MFERSIDSGSLVHGWRAWKDELKENFPWAEADELFLNEDGLEEIDRRGVGMKSYPSTFGVKALDVVENE